MMADDPSYQYKNSHPRRGKALIFKFAQFHDKSYFPRLNYTDLDYARLVTSLEKAGFEVDAVSNMKRNDVIIKLNQVAEDPTHETADCFLCIFLTYGDAHQGLIYAKDSAVMIDEIQNPFLGDKCKGLLGKPKYFVFQASQKSIDIAGDHDEEDEGQTVVATIPAEADFILYWCNMHAETYFWEGNRSNGTLFSRALATEIQRLNDDAESNADGRREADDFKVAFLRTTAVVNSHLETHYRQQLEEDNKILPLLEDSLTKEYLFTNKQATA